MLVITSRGKKTVSLVNGKKIPFKKAVVEK